MTPMKTSKKNNDNSKVTHLSGRSRLSRCGGSALVLAIVTTMLLFIIGLSFFVTTKTEKATVASVESSGILDDAVDAVVNQINTVLVEDLFDPNGFSGLLDGTKGNEYWDYPGTDDPWLASLSPEYKGQTASGDELYAWRHITDLYDNDFDQPSFSFWATSYFFSPRYKDDDHTEQWDSNQADSNYFVLDKVNDQSNALNFARIVGPDESTEMIVDQGDWHDPCDVWPWGAQADADGDGVSDSRWVPVPGLVGPEGQDVYTAVRIIDNCAMINVNTAFRDPSTDTATGEWDGSRLSHVNLEDMQASSENGTLAMLQECRYGIVAGLGSSDGGMPNDDEYIYDTQYDDAVARRLLNPAVVTDSGGDDHYYNPFDIADELNLRNRFFLRSPAIARLGLNTNTWQKTFNPGGGPYKKIPYALSDDDTIEYHAEELGKWFKRVTRTEWTPSDPNNYYNRRAFSTTYSFDRVISPVDPDWSSMPTELKTAWENYNNWDDTDPDPCDWTFMPVCIDDVINGTMPIPVAAPVETLAAAIWLGLGQDSKLKDLDQLKDALDWDNAGDDPRLWMACQLAVNLVDYIDSGNDITKLSVGSDNFFGFESEGEHPYINRLAVSFYNDVAGATGPYTHYAISIYNPGAAAVSGYKIKVGGTNTYTLTLGSIGTGTTVFIDTNNAFGFTDPADGTVATDAFIFVTGDEIVLLDSDDRPCDMVNVDSVPAFNVADDQRDIHYSNARVDGPGSGRLLGSGGANRIFVWEPDIGAPWTVIADSAPGDIGQLGANPTPPANSATNIQVESANYSDNRMLTVGELSNVMFVGGMTVNGEHIPMAECWHRLIDDAGGVGSLEVGKSGKLDIGKECLAGVLRCLTVEGFNPFSDGVDNDGNGFSDDPANDGENNDHDDATDEGDETFILFGEYDELSIAGRININTAPWFVIAQLPWVVDQNLALNSPDRYKLAHAIVAYRDLVDLSATPFSGPDYRDRSTIPDVSNIRLLHGFANIGELLNVAGVGDRYDIRYYGSDSSELSVMPDVTPTDSITDDLEERDIIFHRMSNLVTVRSDVFTAYILVRVGQRGPQRRVIGIFDRSKVFSPTDKPKLVALYPTPDPR